MVSNLTEQPLWEQLDSPDNEVKKGDIEVSFQVGRSLPDQSIRRWGGGSGDNYVPGWGTYRLAWAL